MYRLTFGADDLTRIRLAPGADPFFETVHGIQLLRRHACGLMFGGWGSRLRGRLGATSARLLAEVFPEDRAGLDLSTLVGPVVAFDEGIEGLLAVRRGDLRAEIGFLGTGRRLTPWTVGLGEPDPRPRKELGAAIAAFHDAAIHSYWRNIDACVRADRALRVQRLATDGVERLLSTLCPPQIRWCPPVLEVDIPSSAGAFRDVDLAGRGLVLVPSVLVGEHPILAYDLTDRAAAPKLIYPVVRDLLAARHLWSTKNTRNGLAALLGRTRSVVLEIVADGCGTGEIARRAGISAAAASHHTAVLRRAGLITTQRDGPAVRHSLTALGTALLDGGPPP